MKIIGTLAEDIREELADAERYAKCAVKMKDSDLRLADTFHNLAREELDHSDMLHEQAVRLIKAYDGEVPAGMQAVWDWEHELLADKTARVKALLDSYKS